LQTLEADRNTEEWPLEPEPPLPPPKIGWLERIKQEVDARLAHDDEYSGYPSGNFPHPSQSYHSSAGVVAAMLPPPAYDDGDDEYEEKEAWEREPSPVEARSDHAGVSSDPITNHTAAVGPDAPVPFARSRARAARSQREKSVAAAEAAAERRREEDARRGRNRSRSRSRRAGAERAGGATRPQLVKHRLTSDPHAPTREEVVALAARARVQARWGNCSFEDARSARKLLRGAYSEAAAAAALAGQPQGMQAQPQPWPSSSASSVPIGTRRAHSAPRGGRASGASASSRHHHRQVDGEGRCRASSAVPQYSRRERHPSKSQRPQKKQPWRTVAAPKSKYDKAEELAGQWAQSHRATTAQAPQPRTIRRPSRHADLAAQQQRASHGVATAVAAAAGARGQHRGRRRMGCRSVEGSPRAHVVDTTSARMAGGLVGEPRGAASAASASVARHSGGAGVPAERGGGGVGAGWWEQQLDAAEAAVAESERWLSLSGRCGAYGDNDAGAGGGGGDAAPKSTHTYTEVTRMEEEPATCASEEVSSAAGARGRELLHTVEPRRSADGRQASSSGAAHSSRSQHRHVQSRVRSGLVAGPKERLAAKKPVRSTVVREAEVEALGTAVDTVVTAPPPRPSALQVDRVSAAMTIASPAG
jgi:hypothetical protein